MEEPIHWSLELGRWMAAGLFGMAAIIALYDIVMREIQYFRLRFSDKHTVICGQGPKVIELVRCFVSRENGGNQDSNRSSRVVVILPPEEDYVPYQATGAVVIMGNPIDPAILARAKVQKAHRIVAVCSDDNTNVQVAVEARKLAQEKVPHPVKPINCFVHLADVDLRASLQRTAVFGDQCCSVQFFDLYDSAARGLLLTPLSAGKDSYYMPLDHGGISKTDSGTVRLAILGFGRMGRTLAVRAAQLGHFANGKTIHISVIDKEADRHREMLLFRYPNFEKTCKIEFHKLEIETKQARDLLETWCTEKENFLTSIVVCFDQDSLALEVALRLFPKLQQHGIPMAVRMLRKSGFVSLLKEGQAHPQIHYQIRGFGMLEDTCREEVLQHTLNEALARAIHEDFCRERAKEGRRPPDPSVLPWDDLREDFRDSNRQQADHIAIKLHGIGCLRVPVSAGDPRPAIRRFDDDEIEVMARMEHARWNAERLLAGWEKGEKDTKNKISPYLCPWEDLTADIQDYDRRTARQIPAYLDEIGEKVCRK